MVKKLIIFIVVALVGGVVIAVLNAVFFGGGVERAVAPAGEESLSSSVPVPGSEAPEMIVEETNEHIVIYSDSGFSPSSITVKAGDTVVFRNQSQREFWPASAMHPTHAVYDGTTMSEHCAPGAAPSFDSCRGIEPGGEWSFVFNKIGSWKYHEHLRARDFGTIVVE